MNAPFRHDSNHILDEGDVLLADVAGRIQLPPSDYARAERRYHSLAAWIDREGSPLRGFVGLVYAQGGTATGSVVANRASNDEYDVDAMISLWLSTAADPQVVLDALFDAVRGEPGSRYYDATTRCTRCVQVSYSNQMHIDLTPAVLIVGRPERESIIFHHRAETPSVPGYRVVANPYGFADWFKLNTPPEPSFGEAFRSYASDHGLIAKADAEPLPNQLQPHQVSRALLSLQLGKRFRNIRYNDRKGRCPPGVLLSKLIAEHKADEQGFGNALLSHMIYMRDQFWRSERQGCLYRAVNPACDEDVLTDRWPGSMADQTMWRRDLDYMIERLDFYVRGKPTLAERQAILIDLFGEQAAKAAVLEFAKRMGRDKELEQTRYRPGTGRLVVPAAPALIAPAAGRAEPRTSFFGGSLWRS